MSISDEKYYEEESALHRREVQALRRQLESKRASIQQRRLEIRELRNKVITLPLKGSANQDDRFELELNELRRQLRILIRDLMEYQEEVQRLRDLDGDTDELMHLTEDDQSRRENLQSLEEAFQLIHEDIQLLDITARNRKQDRRR
jgi:hypothetical protein